MQTQILATSKELYPVQPDTEVTRLVWRLSTNDRDDVGRMVLTAKLTTIDREAIARRRDMLAPAIARAESRQIRNAVLQMLIGWSSAKDSNDESAKATLAQYVHVLMGLPMFAIERSCGRWARGEVAPGEVGERQLSRSFAPSTAQVRIVAEKIAQPYFDEFRKCSLLLHTIVQRPPLSEEDRKKEGDAISRMHEEYKRGQAERELNDLQSRAKQEADRTQQARDRNERFIQNEYAKAGVKPVADESGSIRPLSILLQQGWQIMGIKGENVLVAPRGNAP